MSVINSDLRNYWTHKGHEFGLCLTNPNKSLYYINIPKNASTFIKHEFERLGWEYSNYYDYNSSKKIIVVLRDPVDRWISGITEYLKLYYPNLNTLSCDFMDHIFTQITLDDHTEKQIYFINGVDLDKCIFLKVNYNLGHNLNKVLSELDINNNFDSISKEYVSDISEKHLKFKKQILKYIDDRPEVILNIKKHFAADYNLINQIKFYE